VSNRKGVAMRVRWSILVAVAASSIAVAACGSDSGSSGSSGSGSKSGSNAKVALVMTESLKTSNLGKASQTGLDRAKQQYGIDVAVSDSQTPAQMRDTLRDYGARG
jgi:basic membrane lipoprotein Med (substrate-binding protein (PBP1-ABC) superfamily)